MRSRLLVCLKAPQNAFLMSPYLSTVSLAWSLNLWHSYAHRLSEFTPSIKSIKQAPTGTLPRYGVSNFPLGRIFRTIEDIEPPPKGIRCLNDPIIGCRSVQLCSFSMSLQKQDSLLSWRNLNTSLECGSWAEGRWPLDIRGIALSSQASVICSQSNIVGYTSDTPSAKTLTSGISCT